MKKRILFCSLIAFVILLESCNTQPDKSNQVYFNINPLDRKILIPVQLNDSVEAKMTFDTGAGAGTFHLDSTFVAQYAKDLLNKHPDGSAQGGSAWSMNGSPIFGFHTNHIVKIGTTNLGYDHIAILDIKGHFNNLNTDGALNIPKNDTTHVWELNFDYNYLEIHSAKDFKMPMDCFVFPMVKDEINHYPFNIQMPVTIEFAEGDSLTINQMFMIDTGLPGDIALMSNAKELSFFNERDDAVWIAFLSSYYRYYTVKAKLFDSYPVDSLRIYTHDYPNRIRCNYLIGLNFLKRFNVFFDMKERQIGLQPVKNFQRVVNPNVRRFHFSLQGTPQGKIVVREVGDYKANYYKEAGLQEGDEVITINNIPVRKITNEQFLNHYKLDTVLIDIIREGKPLTIVVPVDKNEEQGD